jgi:hypothetical protein
MLIGLALYNSVILDLHFPLTVFKKLLPNQSLGLRDVSHVDRELAQGLRALLDFEPPELVEDVFCRTFEVAVAGGGEAVGPVPDSCRCYQVTWMSFGEERKTPLKAGGADIPVTGDNRRDFVELYVRWLLDDSVSQQFSAFKHGLASAAAAPASISPCM